MCSGYLIHFSHLSILTEGRIELASLEVLLMLKHILFSSSISCSEQISYLLYESIVNSTTSVFVGVVTQLVRYFLHQSISTGTSQTKLKERKTFSQLRCIFSARPCNLYFQYSYWEKVKPIYKSASSYLFSFQNLK